MDDAKPIVEPDSDLYLKTEKLLFFRLAFAAVGVALSIGIGLFTRADFDFDYHPVVAIITIVILYVSASVACLKAKLLRSEKNLTVLNAVLVGSDILCLTALVHFTRGVESDLYVLYLLPILLSSYTFSRVGITRTALFVSICYVGLLIIENASILPYLLDPSKSSGLAATYSHHLWRRILGRSALLVSVAFIWGRFCEYMSGLAEQGANRVREQLKANELLMNDVKAQAAREQLINSINSALRSTLDLNQIFETAVDELGRALEVSSCAIVCHSAYADEPPMVCESMSSALRDANGAGGIFDAKVCAYLLAHKSSYERDPKGGAIIKAFVVKEPARDPEFAPIKAEMERLQFSSLIIKPMMYADESQGVLLIGERDPDRDWSAAEHELIRSVAGQIAVAIEHAELVDQLSRKNKDLLHKNLNLDSKNLELRAVQSQLIHQEKMASLGRLVAGIAHELNNPINFVHGNLPYLREYFEDLKKIITCVDQMADGNKTEFQQLKKSLKYDFLVTDLDNILADLDEGADRIKQIIRNLRSFSRLDEAELKEASVQEGIESTLKILSQYYGRDKIIAETEFATFGPVLCYPGQLNQVWMNLLSNAAQAVSNLAEPRVTVRAEVENNKVLVSISDNGSGIKPEVQSKIFEPFFTTKPVGQGTGLGLSICHSIIERHGGNIWCESELGKGTIFRVEIPIYSRPSDLVRSTSASAHDPD